MFDPRLEQNEEGLFDAPHIELIWMMNTGRFSSSINDPYYMGHIAYLDIVLGKNMARQPYVKRMKLSFMIRMLVLLRLPQHQRSHHLLSLQKIKFQRFPSLVEMKLKLKPRLGQLKSRLDGRRQNRIMSNSNSHLILLMLQSFKDLISIMAR